MYPIGLGKKYYRQFSVVIRAHIVRIHTNVSLNPTDVIIMELVNFSRVFLQPFPHIVVWLARFCSTRIKKTILIEKNNNKTYCTFARGPLYISFRHFEYHGGRATFEDMIFWILWNTLFIIPIWLYIWTELIIYNETLNIYFPYVHNLKNWLDIIIL